MDHITFDTHAVVLRLTHSHTLPSKILALSFNNNNNKNTRTQKRPIKAPEIHMIDRHNDDCCDSWV